MTAGLGDFFDTHAVRDKHPIYSNLRARVLHMDAVIIVTSLVDMKMRAVVCYL